MLRILLTGGGTGGHIYPLLAVLDEIKKITRDNAELFYVGPKHVLNEEFERRDVRVHLIASSKLRRYFDVKNFIDIPKFFFSIIQAFFRMYFLMPDVVFSKGGPGALAVVLAAKFYLIPVVIHDSDSVPGLTSRLSAPFAKKIFISFKTATSYFPRKKTELVGNPVRAGLFLGRPQDRATAKVRLKLAPNEPLVVFLAGSQGSARINSFVFNNLEKLVDVTQVYHQVGEGNVRDAEKFIFSFFKNKKELKNRYQHAGLFDTEYLKLALSAADLIVSRAGAGAIFEIASFGKPSILVPLRGAAGDHQRINAYEYARGGAADVIEENNFTFSVVKVHLDTIMKDLETVQKMSSAASAFAKPEAAETVAKQIVELARGSG